jgi:hypothetical protein
VQAAHFEVLECGIVAVPLIHATPSDNTVIGKDLASCRIKVVVALCKTDTHVTFSRRDRLFCMGRVRQCCRAYSFDQWSWHLLLCQLIARNQNGQSNRTTTCTAARVTFRRAIIIIPLPSSRNTIRRTAKRFGFDPFTDRGIGLGGERRRARVIHKPHFGLALRFTLFRYVY